MLYGAWVVRFLRLAREVASWSKDPSTRVGAVIVDSKKRVVSVGFNGLPRGVVDLPERLHNRDVKYKMIVHGERNALMFASRPVEDCTILTWPFPPCSQCAALIIQTGIRQVVSIRDQLDNVRWRDDFALAREMYAEAGVRLSCDLWNSDLEEVENDNDG